MPTIHEQLRELRHTDATVRSICERGGDVGEALIAVVQEKREMLQRIIELDSIRPRRYRTPDGRVLVWHCPNDLIPEEQL